MCKLHVTSDTPFQSNRLTAASVAGFDSGKKHPKFLVGVRLGQVRASGASWILPRKHFEA